jgi:ribosomal protein S18
MPSVRMADVLLGKQTAPLASDFARRRPTVAEALRGQGEIRNLPNRPRDYLSPVAEALSPTLGGYGMGQIAGDTFLKAQEGDYTGAAMNAPMLAMAFTPGGFKGGGTKGYHGTLKDFGAFKAPNMKDAYMLDRGLGVHFAKDPEISNSFVMERVNGREVGAKEGGRIIPATIPDEASMLSLEQKPFDWAEKIPDRKPHYGIPSDQYAIEKLTAETAYKKDPAMLARYLTEARRIPEGEAKTLAEAMARGETVTIPLEDRPYDLKRFVDNFGGKPYNDADRQAMSDLARQALMEQGYTGIKYINTSPMETATAKDPTSYIVFDPDNIRALGDPSKPWNR